jgi:ATP-binding cassette subfamily C protein
MRLACWSAMEALPALLAGILIATALDRGFLAHRPLLGLAWLAALGLVVLLGSVGTRHIFLPMADLVEPLRDTLVQAVVAGALARAVARPADTDSADVARLTSHVDTARALVAALLRMVRQLAATILAALLGVAVLAPLLGLMVAPPVAAAGALYLGALRRLARRQRDQVLAEEAVATETGAVVAGLRDVLACGAERRAAADVSAAIMAEQRAQRGLALAESIRTVVVTLGGRVPLVAILLAAPALVRHAGMTPGELLGAVTYLTAYLLPALRTLVISVGPWGLQLGVVLRRLREVADQAPTGPPVPPAPGPASAVPASDGRLQTLRLTFAYGPAADLIVTDLDLTLPAGDHLAVVGPSGVGKSTLAQLFVGLLHPTDGAVLLDGRPLSEFPAAVLRRETALIPQEAFVFAGSLRENLCYLVADATDDDLDQATEAIGLAPVVRRLGGYDAALGADGASLSAGERQLVALTRVYLSPARLVILDEATCHLDPAAETRAEQAMAERGGTLIVIAHRISSAIRARRVLLLDGRPSPAVGTHREMLNRSDLYANLVRHWSGSDRLQLPDDLQGGPSRRPAEPTCA